MFTQQLSAPEATAQQQILVGLILQVIILSFWSQSNYCTVPLLQGVVNVASAASRTGAHVLLISTALVTPKNRWSPYRILLNTVIRYNRANEKVSHAL